MTDGSAITKHAVGTFVRIPFGAVGTQIGVVAGYTRNGDIKVRAWNRAQRKWMPNTRTLPLDYLLGRAASWEVRALPAPPKA